MNWIDAEKALYEQALINTENCNKAIARVYLTVMREIEDTLKSFYDTFDPTWSQSYQAQRLSEIFTTVGGRLSVLTNISTEKIEAAFLGQYQGTFNTFAYNLSGYYATPGAFPLLPFTQVDESVIMAGLNQKIGAYSFPDSMGNKQEYLQQQLREAVTASIVKGEGVNQLVARLQETFDKGISSYVATARTEMLKAYSLAQEESVSQAEEMGIEFTFMWLGMSDGRERESHVALNNTYAKIDGNGKPYFIAGKSRGSGPRLLKGIDSAAQNINCRCRRLNVPMKIDTSQDFPIYTIQKKGTGKDKDEVFNIKLPDFEEYLKMIS